MTTLHRAFKSYLRDENLRSSRDPCSIEILLRGCQPKWLKIILADPKTRVYTLIRFRYSDNKCTMCYYSLYKIRNYPSRYQYSVLSLVLQGAQIKNRLSDPEYKRGENLEKIVETIYNSNINNLIFVQIPVHMTKYFKLF